MAWKYMFSDAGRGANGNLAHESKQKVGSRGAVRVQVLVTHQRLTVYDIGDVVNGGPRAKRLNNVPVLMLGPANVYFPLAM